MVRSRLAPTRIQRPGQPGPVVVFTGAGFSAANELATLHDPGGVWEQHSPTEFVWRSYSWRRERAGSRRVVRLHGSLWTSSCTPEGTARPDETIRAPAVAATTAIAAAAVAARRRSA